jgi:hypothetical protein
MSFFIHGGKSVEAMVPNGRFVVKVARGDTWCGEGALFGGSTSMDKADRTLTFFEGEGHTVTVTPTQTGNLPFRPIQRGDF